MAYWPADTKVTLRTNLKEVDVGDGIWGDENREISFKVGRSQISVVDVDKLKMIVYREGKKVREFPVSTGKLKSRTVARGRRAENGSERRTLHAG